MKKSTVELIEKRFKDDFEILSWEIRSNKKELKELSEKQRQLKDTRKGLFEILSMIRGYK